MTSFRITEQEARVVERSYDIEAPSADEAIEAFIEMDASEKEPLLVHTETLRMNCEVTNGEATT